MGSFGQFGVDRDYNNALAGVVYDIDLRSWVAGREEQRQRGKQHVISGFISMAEGGSAWYPVRSN